jgi:hypothetical protein
MESVKHLGNFPDDVQSKSLEYFKENYEITKNNFVEFLNESFAVGKLDIFDYVTSIIEKKIEDKDVIPVFYDIFICKIITSINYESEDLKFLNYLLKKNFKIKNHTCYCNSCNYLYECIVFAKPLMLKELIKFKADVNYGDYYGNNALKLLLKHKYSGCYDILIKNKINVNNQNIIGKTCLHYAIEDNNTNMVIKLINSKSKIDIRDNELKKTALDLVQENNNYSIKKEIIDLILSINKQKRKRKFNETKSDLCIFCLDKLDEKEENNFMTKCYHVYHKNCWNDYPKKQECPICRQNA